MVTSPLPREAAPDIKIPVVLVSTPYIGVSPEDIESLTVPLERELKGIKDIKTMTSTSYEGTSSSRWSSTPTPTSLRPCRRSASG
ncbi:MAG: efflux RND transporter permease subunit [Deltaproteobacteria bacterium]|nr:efflux RND transporter permease subunit [Deltaproteobacteria bacterium]